MELFFIAAAIALVAFILLRRSKRKAHRLLMKRLSRLSPQHEPSGNEIPVSENEAPTNYHSIAVQNAAPITNKNDINTEHAYNPQIRKDSAQTVQIEKVERAPAIVSVCKKCGDMKHESNFFNSKKRLGESTKWCKDCLDRLSEKRKLGRYKKCPKCRNNRLISSYFESLKTKDGLSKWCKMCHKKLN